MDLSSSARDEFAKSGTLVSLFLYVHNGAELLSVCLQSLLQQSYKNIELIIIDDASEDDSLAIIESFRPACEKRFRSFIVKTQRQQGSLDCFSRFCFLFQGSYAFVLCPHTQLETGAIQALVSAAQANPQLDLLAYDLYPHRSPFLRIIHSAYHFFRENHEGVSSTQTDFVQTSFVQYQKLLRRYTFFEGCLLSRSFLQEIALDASQSSCIYNSLLRAAEKSSCLFMSEVEKAAVRGDMLGDLCVKQKGTRAALEESCAKQKPLEADLKALNSGHKGLVDEARDIALTEAMLLKLFFSDESQRAEALLQAVLEQKLNEQHKLTPQHGEVEEDPLAFTCAPSYLQLYKQKKDLLKKGKKLRVGFFVVFEGVFPGQAVFEKMLSDTVFSPYIVIIPDVTKGKDNFIEQLEKSFTSLYDLYGERVLSCYDAETNRFNDFSALFDVVIFANPYDMLTLSIYSLSYWKKKALTVHMVYGFFCTQYCTKEAASPFYRDIWKNYFNSFAERNLFRQSQKSLMENSVVSGYAKMDSLALYPKTAKKRKSIVLASHHSVFHNTTQLLPLSTFLDYADLFLLLPKIFPEVDFIFRPHPLLLPSLRNENVWGRERTERYMEQIASIPHMSVSDRGSYFRIFAEADAIIHDCGSFTLESLFTKQACCYLLRSATAPVELFDTIGQKALSMYYLACKAEDILSFIEYVVLQGNDYKKFKRSHYVEQELAINYPHASDIVLKDLRDSFLRE